MADAAGTLAHIVLYSLNEAGDLAQALHHVDALAAFNRDAGRIVAAILKALQALEQNALGLKGARVTNNSAHIETPNKEEYAY